MFFKFFDKESTRNNDIASGKVIKKETKLKQQLAHELRKPIIKKFKKHKLHSCFMDNI